MWVKLSDTFAEDPRLERAGVEAFVLQVAALCYAGRQLTDGYLSARTARRLWDLEDPQATIDTLVREGLWEVDGDGYRIVDYLKNQPSKQTVETQQAEKKIRQDRWLAKRAESRDASRGGASQDAPHPDGPQVTPPLDGHPGPPRPAPPRRKAGRGEGEVVALTRPPARGPTSARTPLPPAEDTVVTFDASCDE